MDYRHILLLVIALLNSWMALRVLRRSWRSAVNVSFAAFGFSVALWSLTIFQYLRVTDESARILWMQLTHVAGVLIATSFLLFTIFFSRKKISRLFLFLLGCLIPLSVLVSILDVDTFVRAVSSDTITFRFGTHTLFALFFYSYFLVGFITLIRCWRNETALGKRQLLPIIIGIGIAALFATTTDIVFVSPLINEQRFIWLGPLFTTAMVVGIHRAYGYFFGIPLASSAVRMQ